MRQKLNWRGVEVIEKMERETGLEPATSSLGSWHSTTELLPLALLFFYLSVLKGLRPLYHESIPSITSIQNHGFDRKMDIKQSGKTRFRRSRLLSTLLSIPRQIQHITLDVRRPNGIASTCCYHIPAPALTGCYRPEDRQVRSCRRRTDEPSI